MLSERADTEGRTGCEVPLMKRPRTGRSTDTEWVPGCQGLGEGMGLMLMRTGFPFGVMSILRLDRTVAQLTVNVLKTSELHTLVGKLYGR